MSLINVFISTFPIFQLPIGDLGHVARHWSRSTLGKSAIGNWQLAMPSLLLATTALDIDRHLQLASDKAAPVRDPKIKAVKLRGGSVIDEIFSARRTAAVNVVNLEHYFPRLSADHKRSCNAQCVSISTRFDFRALKANVRVTISVQAICRAQMRVTPGGAGVYTRGFNRRFD